MQVDEFVQIITVAIQKNATMCDLFFFGFDASWQQTMDAEQLTLFTGKC